MLALRRLCCFLVVSSASCFLVRGRRRPPSHRAASEPEDEGDADYRDFRNELMQRFASGSLTGEPEAKNDTAQGLLSGEWAYETPLLESGCVLLGGTRQDFGFGLRQQYFHCCVVLLTQHDDEFTKGVIVNRPSRKKYDGWTMWCGGDVEEGGLFSAPWAAEQRLQRPPVVECLGTKGFEGSREVVRGLWLTSFDDAKTAVRNQRAEKTDFLCFAGYAGWAPGQLQEELDRKSWFVAATGGSTLIAELEQEKEHLSDLDDGLGTWTSLMSRIGYPDEAPSMFDDRMLRSWVTERLSIDAASRKEKKAVQERKQEAIKRIGRPMVPGTLLSGRAVGGDFLLERQYLHKSIVLLLAEQGDVVIGVILNRATRRSASLNTQPSASPYAAASSRRPAAEMSRRVAFGGDVGVQGAPGGLIWIKKGGLPAPFKCEPLPASPAVDDEHLYVLGAQDVLAALAADKLNLNEVLALSGVVAFPVTELDRLLGTGALTVLDTVDMEQLWQLHANDHPNGFKDTDGVNLWQAAGTSTPASNPDYEELADEALATFVATFLLPPKEEGDSETDP